MNLRKDKVVQSTDGDALSSKYSAVQKRYLRDDFIDLFVAGAKQAAAQQGPGSARKTVAQFQPKLPLINRGTFVRHHAIDVMVERFLSAKKPGQRVQIISLGAGSDTRPFSLWNENKEYKNEVLYHEIDFAVSVQRKKDIILQDSTLRELVGSDEKQSEENKTSFLSTQRYHLHGIDLRTIGPDFVLPGSDPSLATLIISECCLCYLEPDQAKKVISWITNEFHDSTIIMYEPLSGQDQFGQVMIENLASRGISIPSMTKFPSLESQIERFKTAGYTEVLATSMDVIHDEWVSPEEQQRIHGLEFLDEREELLLLLKHYCVVWASKLDVSRRER
ncbi:Leucine carboxyl methyltransferase 1 [Yarrowia sp. C11]|nr:Leucine carboxyl methyltransferase 1 [Yarrowia sp. E02]KAG5369537.1 Leucine carboxyl methyltransferase 1 [Yarrowia sp. C11]